MKVQSDNVLNSEALLDPNRLDQSRLDPSRLDESRVDVDHGRGLATDGLAPATVPAHDAQDARDPGEDVLQAKVWDDASPRSLAYFARGFDAPIAPDAQALDRAADAILLGLAD
ncbi:MAG TPA: hypothetical protein VJ696_08515 [Rhodanobacteraceae bacterium]|nr:hypothetical protein [Rhodanobacteraceae bacterium]